MQLNTATTPEYSACVGFLLGLLDVDSKMLRIDFPSLGFNIFLCLLCVLCILLHSCLLGRDRPNSTLNPTPLYVLSRP